MNREELDRLKLKKQALKQKLDITAAIQSLEHGWLPWYDTLLAHKVEHEILYLNCVAAPDQPYWVTALKQAPLAAYQFPTSVIKVPNTLFVHEQLLCFPNTHPLRYLPKLPNQATYETPSFILQQAAAAFSIPEKESVYFFFTRYTPVLKVPFGELQQHVDVFYDLPEDTCVLPLSSDWMIFRSLEEEWRWGKRAN